MLVLADCALCERTDLPYRILIVDHHPVLNARLRRLDEDAPCFAKKERDGSLDLLSAEADGVAAKLVGLPPDTPWDRVREIWMLAETGTDIAFRRRLVVAD